MDRSEVAATHAAALDAHIRVLRLRRAVLRAVADRASDPEEMQRMHKLAHLSDEERRRIVADFLDEVFEDLDIEPGSAARMRSAQPELPDDPTTEQLDAWIELAELVQDEGFRRTIREIGHRRPRRALLAAAGDHQRPAAGPDHRAPWEWLIAALPSSSGQR